MYKNRYQKAIVIGLHKHPLKAFLALSGRLL